MFLGNLEIKKKYLFRELSIYAAKSDNDFDDKEKLIIDAHCNEMHVDNNNYENEKELLDVIAELSELLTYEEKRSVFLELVSVVLADEVYNEYEKSFMNDLKNSFGITDEEEINAIALLTDLKKVYKGMADFLIRK